LTSHKYNNTYYFTQTHKGVSVESVSISFRYFNKEYDDAKKVKDFLNAIPNAKAIVLEALLPLCDKTIRVPVSTSYKPIFSKNLRCTIPPGYTEEEWEYTYHSYKYGQLPLSKIVSGYSDIPDKYKPRPKVNFDDNGNVYVGNSDSHCNTYAPTPNIKPDTKPEVRYDSDNDPPNG
jgi:hypothetical protein